MIQNKKSSMAYDLLSIQITKQEYKITHTVSHQSKNLLLSASFSGAQQGTLRQGSNSQHNRFRNGRNITGIFLISLLSNVTSANAICHSQLKL